MSLIQSFTTISKMKRKHIDEVQPATVKEHYDLIMKDNSEIDYKQCHITSEELPDWYDEKLFKIAQNLFMRNITSMLMSSITGLVGLLAVPSLSKLLLHTNQSHTPLLAYKRYYRTFFYVYDMYKWDPRNPNDKFFKIINIIRSKHAFSTNKARNGGFGAIYQRDMAITQFAFIGYILLMPQSFALFIKPEEQAGLIHFWRVIGHILGTSDRINVCRKSVDETLELFRMLMDKFTEYLNNPQPEFDQLMNAMLDGLWYGKLDLNKKIVLWKTYQFSNVKREIPLGCWGWLIFQFYDILLRLTHIPYIGDVIMIIFNKIVLFNFYLVKNFSLIAWMSFGKEQSQLHLY